MTDNIYFKDHPKWKDGLFSSSPFYPFYLADDPFYPYSIKNNSINTSLFNIFERYITDYDGKVSMFNFNKDDYNKIKACLDYDDRSVDINTLIEYIIDKIGNNKKIKPDLMEKLMLSIATVCLSACVVQNDYMLSYHSFYYIRNEEGLCPDNFLPYIRSLDYPYLKEYTVWKKSYPFFPYRFIDDPLNSETGAKYCTDLITEYRHNRSIFIMGHKDLDIVANIETCIDNGLINQERLLTYIYNLVCERAYNNSRIKPDYLERFMLSIVTVQLSMCQDCKRNETGHDVIDTLHMKLKHIHFCYTRLHVPFYTGGEVLYENEMPVKPKFDFSPKVDNRAKCAVCNWVTSYKCPACGKCLCNTSSDSYAYQAWNGHEHKRSCYERHACLLRK